MIGSVRREGHVGLRVLVVEDNPINLELVTFLLEQEECEVTATDRGETALEFAAHTAFDLVLMDLELPGINGYEATRRLKVDPATASIPVIALTAQAMRGEEARARVAGCSLYLTKPLNTERFREVLLALSGKREASGERPA
jgi:CheY-like chemotaxis protein